ncbi:MAG: hypothetical protein ABH952_00190 [Candidatus Omnitrophota bacterium]
MRVKIFGKHGCAKCITTKNKLTFFLNKWKVRDKVGLEFHDLDTVEGMAEGAYHDVLNIPTTIFSKEENTIARWDGEVPKSEEFKKHLSCVEG